MKCVDYANAQLKFYFLHFIYVTYYSLFSYGFLPLNLTKTGDNLRNFEKKCNFRMLSALFLQNITIFANEYIKLKTLWDKL